MIDDEDQYDAFYMLAPIRLGVETLPNPANKRLVALEKKVKSIESNGIFGIIAMNMCLVLNLVIPDKFKTPDFEKYKGKSCPRSHLVMYFRKMASHTENDNYSYTISKTV